MQSSQQDRRFLIRWVQTQINYFLRTGQLSNNKFLQNTLINWSELISNGFALKLFQAIDPSAFSKLLSFDATNHHESSMQVLLQFYWKAINQYLVQNYSKEIDQFYFKKQTTFDVLVYNTNHQESCESSTIQLIKLLFYLLVQKENTGQRQQVIVNNEVKGGVELFETKQTVGVNVGGELREVTQRESIVEEQEESNFVVRNQFLARICELQQQVQQYLVTVIQSVQEQELLRPLKRIKEKSSCWESSWQMVVQPGTNSNFRRIILKEIQNLQQENEHLRQKIEETIYENNKLQTQIQYATQSENKIINQINQYNLQKQQLFTYLNLQNGIIIHTFDDFIQILKHIQHENQSLSNAIAQIEERNYQLEKSNALKLHSINKNAAQITQVNQQITTFKSKIKSLQQDIEYLDQIVNSDLPQDTYNSCLNDQFNAPMIRSINVDDQNEMLFRKSVESELRHSVGNVLRENHNINNKKTINKMGQNLSEKRSLARYSNTRMSLQDRQKSLRKKNSSHYRLSLQNQQNIQPSPFCEEDYIKSDTQNYSLNQSKLLQKSQQQEDQREIECEKQKYRQQLVNSLELLYKEIADLSAEIAQIKQSNMEYRKKNKFNDKKIASLNALHSQFLKEFCLHQ